MRRGEDGDIGARGLRRVLVLALTALLSSTLLVVAGPGVGGAHAAALCTGHKVRTLPFATGRAVVYKSRGYVCAVTLAKRTGVRQSMSVSVQARGSRAVVDSGRFTHHAGPVTVHAGHRCVRVKGHVGSKSVSSGWILC
ncbi:hypothetical protein ACIRF8_03695 [Streptomyces sp. NPDC102406]|uniref:hypothetical protein n=1 Tax=Streptomyces sp. NPDC102406 TaxID=3366171 RepID=UPI0038057203